MTSPYHVIYSPQRDEILDVFRASHAGVVRQHLARYPNGIGMQLEATSLEDLHQELVDLGFNSPVLEAGRC